MWHHIDVHPSFHEVDSPPSFLDHLVPATICSECEALQGKEGHILRPMFQLLQGLRTQKCFGNMSWRLHFSRGMPVTPVGVGRVELENGRNRGRKVNFPGPPALPPKKKPSTSVRANDAGMPASKGVQESAR